MTNMIPNATSTPAPALSGFNSSVESVGVRQPLAPRQQPLQMRSIESAGLASSIFSSPANLLQRLRSKAFPEMSSVLRVNLDKFSDPTLLHLCF